MQYSNLVDRLFAAPGNWRFKACRDPACACLWLDPCPIPADIGLAYESYYTHATGERHVQSGTEQSFLGFAGRAVLAGKYGQPVGGVPAPLGRVFALLLALHPAIGLQLQLFLRHLPPPAPGMTLLDVGCGEGLALKVLEQVGWHVVGQDVDAKAVAVAAHRGLQVHHGPLEACGFESASFDAVTMSHVIEHVHDPESLLRQVHRLLRPGGTLVSITPNVHSSNHARFGPSWLALDPPRHLVLFSASALEAVAKRAGFKELTLTSSVRATAASEIASRHIRKCGRYRWGDRGSLGDRWAGTYRQWADILGDHARSLRGDELILTART